MAKFPVNLKNALTHTQYFNFSIFSITPSDHFYMYRVSQKKDKIFNNDLSIAQNFYFH